MIIFCTVTDGANIFYGFSLPDLFKAKPEVWAFSYINALWAVLIL